MTNIVAPAMQIAVVTGGVEPAEIVYDQHTAGLQWLTCRRLSEHRFDFRADGKTVSSIDFANAVFDLSSLTAVVLTPDSANGQIFKERWLANFPAVHLDFIEVADLDPAALARAATAALVKSLIRHRAQSGQAVLDLAVYRGEYERLQHGFSRLEQYITRYCSQEQRLIFEYADVPGKQGAVPAALDATTRHLFQILPADSLGLAGLALHLRSKLTGTADLKISLRAVEAERLFGAWSIAATDVQPGWLRLTLERAIDEPALGLMLSIEAPFGAPQSLFSWGAPNPFPEFCAHDRESGALEAPLAMRIYASLPGVRVPHAPGAFTPDNALRPPVTPVSTEDYARVQQVFPQPMQGRTPLVTYDAAAQFITVHPHEGGIRTVARIDLLVPADVWLLSAVISLAHEQSNPVSFALLASVRLGKQAEAHLVEDFDESAIGFSGWIELAPLGQRRISVFLPKACRGPCSFYLFTQQAQEASPDFAWARFAQFEFNAAPGGALQAAHALE